MLDYDGTLAPFRPERNQAVPYPGICDILDRIISSSNTRVIIVSGRAIRDLTPLLNLKQLPEIWGSHGVERLMTNGCYRTATSDELPSEGLAKIYWWARDNDLLAFTERKPAGIAFHWRGMEAAEIENLRRKINDKWENNTAEYGLTLYEFDGGLELRVPGITKGDAVRKIIDESDKKAGMAYLGDDVTDEDAFNALPPNGLGVLVRPEHRETAADLWIKPPEELLQFLETWVENTR